MWPFPMASEKSPIFPPTEKNLPVPVSMTDLQSGSDINWFKVEIRGWKLTAEKVFEEASGDNWTTAIPSWSLSVDTGMDDGGGMSS